MDDDLDLMDIVDSDPEDAVNDLFHNNVNQGYYVAMFLQRIIASGELNVLHRDPYYRAELPRIKYTPVLIKLKKNPIYQEIQLASNQILGRVATSKKSAPSFTTPSLLDLLARREHGIGLKHGSFTESQRCGINNMQMPNFYKQLMKLESKVYCGALSDNGNYFVTASQDHVLRVFDASRSTYRRINRIVAKDVHWGILDLAFTKRGDEFAYSTWSTCLQVARIDGDSNDIKSLNMLPFTPRFCMFSLAFSGCDKLIIGGSSDGCLYVFDRQLNERIMRVPVALYGRHMHDGKSDVNTCGFVDNSSDIIYTGLDNGAIRIWDRRCLNDTSPEPVGFFIGHVDGVTHIDSKMDGRYLISNSKDQSIKLWDMRMFARSNSEKSAMRLLQKSQQKLNWDYRWDEVPSELYESTPVPTIRDNSIMTYRGHRVRKSLLRAKFSPIETTGQRYIYTGCSTGHLIVYDLLTGAIVKKINGHKDIVRDVAWHPRRQEILTSSWDGNVNLNTYVEQCVDIEQNERRAPKRTLRNAEPRVLLRPAEMTSAANRRGLRRSQRIANQRAFGLLGSDNER